MSELAKRILKNAKEEKATFVDLGNCGLDGYLSDELFDEHFIKNLEDLSLSDFVGQRWFAGKRNFRFMT